MSLLNRNGDDSSVEVGSAYTALRRLTAQNVHSLPIPPREYDLAWADISRFVSRFLRSIVHCSCDSKRCGCLWPNCVDDLSSITLSRVANHFVTQQKPWLSPAKALKATCRNVYRDALKES